MLFEFLSASSTLRNVTQQTLEIETESLITFATSLEISNAANPQKCKSIFGAAPHRHIAEFTGL